MDPKKLFNELFPTVEKLTESPDNLVLGLKFLDLIQRGEIDDELLKALSACSDTPPEDEENNVTNSSKSDK